MSRVVIYPIGNGDIAVIIPAESCGLSVEEVAEKDTPDGVPYIIVDASEMPQDREFREAWTADFSAPHGYGNSHGSGE